ncbi:DegT/DnrJ/EryC1/StrS family aminotransferase [Marinobacter sp. OP 3.4]|uniref:DegT/DnrJ/EryC1/StrS family aminotransferase n=1 Tax=Marinobacter sp. OP 3.4 TaxID=3076501 RepID=UPI002E1D9E63
MNIPYFRLSSCEQELANVQEVLESGWLTTGKWAQKLESLFAEHCGTKHALAVNSCTAALHLGIEALGIGPGDKVIVPSLTFTASAEVIRYVGADPIFVDIDKDTLLMDPRVVAEAIRRTEGIKAVVAVHFGGQSVELDGEEGLIAVCKEYGVRLLQDAAHAFPAQDTYGPVGSVGDITCFSFYANKTITSGEGGMLVTNDDDIARRVKMMRLHGIDRDVWDRFSGNKASSWVYDVKAPGFKYNMPDLNAAVAVAQFVKAEAFREARQAIAERYNQAFGGLSGVQLVKWRVPVSRHSHHLFPIVLGKNSKICREEFIEKLSQCGIGTSVHYRPLHHMSYYREKYSLDAEKFPNTESYWNGCVSLPVYPAMSDDNVDRVVSEVSRLLT